VDPFPSTLSTPIWPPIGSTMRQENEAIKAQLIRTSAPWKVTYILADTPLKTTSLMANSTDSMAPRLDAALVKKLSRFGITTTGLADLVIRKKQQQAGFAPRPVTNRSRRMVQVTIRQETEQLEREIHRYFPNARLFSRAVQSLTSDDIRALRQYAAACGARDRQAFLRANPVRYPAYTPPSIMQRPAIRNVGARFTDIPPAGQ
jgi:hypothetical protein